MKFWKTRPIKNGNGFTKDFFVEEYFSGGNSNPIPEGDCKKRLGNAKLDTTFSTFYMEAKVEGPLVLNTGVELPENYCYAYSFQPIQFTYDYGDGKCNFEVSMYLINKLSVE